MARYPIVFGIPATVPWASKQRTAVLRCFEGNGTVASMPKAIGYRSGAMMYKYDGDVVDRCTPKIHADDNIGV